MIRAPGAHAFGMETPPQTCGLSGRVVSGTSPRSAEAPWRLLHFGQGGEKSGREVEPVAVVSRLPPDLSARTARWLWPSSAVSGPPAGASTRESRRLGISSLYPRSPSRPFLRFSRPPLRSTAVGSPLPHLRNVKSASSVFLCFIYASAVDSPCGVVSSTSFFSPWPRVRGKRSILPYRGPMWTPPPRHAEKNPMNELMSERIKVSSGPQLPSSQNR